MDDDHVDAPMQDQDEDPRALLVAKHKGAADAKQDPRSHYALQQHGLQSRVLSTSRHRVALENERKKLLQELEYRLQLEQKQLEEKLAREIELRNQEDLNYKHGLALAGGPSSNSLFFDPLTNVNDRGQDGDLHYAFVRGDSVGIHGAGDKNEVKDFKCVAEPGVTGFSITKVFGAVSGSALRVRDEGDDMATAAKALKVDQVEAQNLLIQNAKQRGANAIVGLRFDATAPVGSRHVEVVAYGTAVVIVLDKGKGKEGDKSGKNKDGGAANGKQQKGKDSNDADTLYRVLTNDLQKSKGDKKKQPGGDGGGGIEGISYHHIREVVRLLETAGGRNSNNNSNGGWGQSGNDGGWGQSGNAGGWGQSGNDDGGWGSSGNNNNNSSWSASGNDGWGGGGGNNDSSWGNSNSMWESGNNGSWGGSNNKNSDNSGWGGGGGGNDTWNSRNGSGNGNSMDNRGWGATASGADGWGSSNGNNSSGGNWGNSSSGGNHPNNGTWGNSSSGGHNFSRGGWGGNNGSSNWDNTGNGNSWTNNYNNGNRPPGGPRPIFDDHAAYNDAPDMLFNLMRGLRQLGLQGPQRGYQNGPGPSPRFGWE